MRAREYDKRVEVHVGTVVSDGFGGSTVTYALSVTSWAKVVNGVKMSQRLTDLGITDIANTIVVYLRHRTDFEYEASNYYLVYRNEKYVPKSVANSDFKDVDIEIIAQREI